MPSSYDVIVVGLGAMGSATLYHLARRGHRVLGLDRFSPPHTLGSSHGQTRIIREAYFEHPVYVPMVQRAYELWAELGRHLYLQTGGLMIGPPGGVLVSGARRSAEEHHLPHEHLDAAAVRRRYPGLQPDDSMSALWEPRAGILFPDQCIREHLRQAIQCYGADVLTDTPILKWSNSGAGVEVRTERKTFTAGQLVLSAGAWIRPLLGPDSPEFQVERQTLFWFAPTDPSLFSPERCPIHMWEYDSGRYCYGFPDLGHGVKLALHHEGEVTTADTVRRTIDDHDTESVRALAQRFLPRADGPLLEATVCLYTNMPDGHFLIDRHPGNERVLVVSPCSGHGFKFSSAIGEIAADLVEGAKPKFDLSLFRWR
jgi:sarcosine oxidase